MNRLAESVSKIDTVAKYCSTTANFVVGLRVQRDVVL